MTKRCFSSQQLYTLRNDVAVQVLIEKTLRIPCRVTEGCFRFLCPLCKAFDTAVNLNTNLARCFRCKKNFNTIDLVMLIRQADFVQSVKFLQSIYQNTPVSQNRGSLEALSGTNPKSGSRIKLNTPLGKSDSGPCHIGKILDSAMPSKPDNDRIVKLEQQLECLGRQIENITRTINDSLPSK